MSQRAMTASTRTARPTASHAEPAVPTSDDWPIPYTLADPPPACADRVEFCAGNPVDHSDPGEHIHQGTEHSISGPYGKNLLAFHLQRFGDGTPHLCFSGEGDWPELGVPAVDQLIHDLTGHAARLRAARNELAQANASAAEPVGARTWTLTIARGGKVTGPCPTWCQEEHSGTYAADKLSLHLGDFAHFAVFDGATLNVFTPGKPEDGGGVFEEDVFHGHISVHPFAADARRRQPTVSLEVLPDHWMEDLGPDELADVVTKLRQQADRLDQVHGRLVQARAEWDACQ